MLRQLFQPWLQQQQQQKQDKQTEGKGKEKQEENNNTNNNSSNKNMNVNNTVGVRNCKAIIISEGSKLLYYHEYCNSKNNNNDMVDADNSSKDTNNNNDEWLQKLDEALPVWVTECLLKVPRFVSFSFSVHIRSFFVGSSFVLFRLVSFSLSVFFFAINTECEA